MRIIALGHRMPDWVNRGVEEYTRRMPRDFPLNVIQLKPEPRSDNAGDVARSRVLEVEAQRVQEALGEGCLCVVLDETGRQVNTRDLAQRLSQWREQVREVAFVIGSADGTAPILKKKAHWLWSLSALTLPHGLVRVVLAEQLYRAVSILNHHPYHRD